MLYFSWSLVDAEGRVVTRKSLTRSSLNCSVVCNSNLLPDSSAQPSQLRGNIKNIGDPDEPVIGYVNAATITSYRIFIRREQIKDRIQLVSNCITITTTQDSAAHYLSDPRLAPAYYVSGGGITLSTVDCVDCRLKGGTTNKPAYWE